MQEAWAGRNGARCAVRLPPAEHEVVPGVTWGHPAVPNTPAYWAVRCKWEDDLPDYVSRNGSLIEETGFCLLGGYGIKFEVNEAAFERLKQYGAFCTNSVITHREIVALLTEPLFVSGRAIRYRFPNQRADRIANMRNQLCKLSLSSLTPLQIRKALQSIKGIGPKTASWIVRNVFGSDDVAIIDIHILRACSMMGVFPQNNTLPRDYEPLEQQFLKFSNAISVRPSILDAVMWLEMRSISPRQWARH